MSTFWSSQNIEPKRSYQWVGLINMMNGNSDSVDHGAKPFLVKSFQRPTMQIQVDKVINTFTSETELNTKYYTWDDISITIIDIQQKELNASRNIYKWLESLGYQPQQDLNNLSRLFTNLYKPEKLTLSLQHINSEGRPFEQWDFIEAQPQTINFGGAASYDSDDTLAVELNFAYVAAKYTSLTSNSKSISDDIIPPIVPAIGKPKGGKSLITDKTDTTGFSKEEVQAWKEFFTY